MSEVHQLQSQTLQTFALCGKKALRCWYEVDASRERSCFTWITSVNRGQKLEILSEKLYTRGYVFTLAHPRWHDPQSHPSASHPTLLPPSLWPVPSLPVPLPIQYPFYAQSVLRPIGEGEVSWSVLRREERTPHEPVYMRRGMETKKKDYHGFGSRLSLKRLVCHPKFVFICNLRGME